MLDWQWARLGDYWSDAKPAVDALAAGHLRDALNTQPLMGPFSILLRAPFVAVAHSAGADALLSYQVGVVPCLAAAIPLGVALARWSPGARRTRGLSILIVLIAVATPASGDAIRTGHPEEVLGAAVSVGAVVLAARGRTVGATVALGLALATKQWAVLALPPVLLATHPGSRWRVGAGASAIALGLTLPQVIANSEGFTNVSRQAATSPPGTRVWSWWYLAGDELPGWLAQATHPAIVLSALPLAVLVYRRGGEALQCALSLLVVLFLIRCIFDPVNNYYYHVPLVLALLAWETSMHNRLLPYVTLYTVASLIVTHSYLSGRVSESAVNAFYVVWTGVLAVYMIRILYLLPRHRTTVS